MKEGQGQALPTSAHCPQAPESRHPSTPSSVLVHLSPLMLPTPSRSKANFGFLGPAPTRLPPWIGQWRAPGQHSPSQTGARKGQPAPTPTLTTSTCSVLGTALQPFSRARPSRTSLCGGPGPPRLSAARPLGLTHRWCCPAC